MTVEELRQILAYQPDGSLVWLNGPRAGRGAGYAHHDGYWTIEITRGGVTLLRTFRHRVVWALHAGEWPSQPIDHKDRNRGDDRIENLRLASPTQNSANRSRHRNNTSGHRGVYFHKGHDRWRACIRINGRKVNLGTFTTAEAAAKAVEAAGSATHPEFWNN